MYQKRECFFVEDLTAEMRETILDCCEASHYLDISEKSLVQMRMKNRGPKWYKYYNGRVGYRIPDIIFWLIDREKQRCAAENEEYSDRRMEAILRAGESRFRNNPSDKHYPLPQMENRRAYSVNVQVEQWVNI